jgi:hypothetical protein
MAMSGIESSIVGSTHTFGVCSDDVATSLQAHTTVWLQCVYRWTYGGDELTCGANEQHAHEHSAEEHKPHLPAEHTHCAVGGPLCVTHTTRCSDHPCPGDTHALLDHRHVTSTVALDQNDCATSPCATRIGTLAKIPSTVYGAEKRKSWHLRAARIEH